MSDKRIPCSYCGHRTRRGYLTDPPYDEGSVLCLKCDHELHPEVYDDDDKDTKD